MNKYTLTSVAFFTLLCCIGNLQAEVYKRTNPDGSVEFTDVPSKQKDEAVELSPMSTFKAPPVRSIPSTTAPKQDEPASDYTSLAITDPADDTAIRSNSGDLSVSISLQPALKADHSLVLLVDDQPMGNYADGSVSLTNVDRGTHTLTAQVLDKDGKELIRATPVIVHLLRYSAIKH
mgnify:CR=1 FL=1